MIDNMEECDSNFLTNVKGDGYPSPQIVDKGLKSQHNKTFESFFGIMEISIKGGTLL